MVAAGGPCAGALSSGQVSDWYAGRPRALVNTNTRDMFCVYVELATERVILVTSTSFYLSLETIAYKCL